MFLSQQAFEDLLPPYLNDISKGRIRTALSQFQNGDNIDYSTFYALDDTPFLMQADIVNSVQAINWGNESDPVEVGYNPAMFISNTCDVNFENMRSLNVKEALFAPILPVNAFLEDCKEAGFTQQQTDDFIRVLKKQEHTNLFYLPANQRNGVEYFVRLDRIYWLPVTRLKNIVSDLPGNRFMSLSMWAWYLFIVKLSLHLCRAPETIERKEN